MIEKQKIIEKKKPEKLKKKNDTFYSIRIKNILSSIRI